VSCPKNSGGRSNFHKIIGETNTAEQISQLRALLGDLVTSKLLAIPQTMLDQPRRSEPSIRLVHLTWCICFRPDLLTTVLELLTLSKYNPTLKTPQGNLRQIKHFSEKPSVAASTITDAAG
jgi:hypothetical protein